MNRKSSILGLILLMLFSIAKAQDRLEPSKMYKAGETLNAPAFGISAIVPEGWIGYLPRETEIFIFSEADNGDSEIFTMARENTLESIKRNWGKGLSLSDGIQLTVSDNVVQDGNIMHAAVGYTGTSGGQRSGYVVSACGDHGICATFLLLSSNKRFATHKATALDLARRMKFVPPTALAALEAIDWNSFLEGQYLYSRKDVGTQQSLTQIWLNSDHSFSSKSIPANWVATSAKKYAGKKKGAWSITKRDGNDFLVLDYDKLAQVVIRLEKVNDEITLNGETIFVTKDIQ